MDRSTSSGGSRVFLAVICVVAALGGFLFGFDTAVISGCVGFLQDQFSLTAWTKGYVVSSALIGCICGAAVAGWLSDRFGRRSMLMLSAVLFFVSAVGCTVPPGIGTLVAARWIGGLGIGIASMLSPLYISEISPPAVRGALVAMYQLAITVGILVAYFSNAAIVALGQSAGLDSDGFLHWVVVAEPWRAMLGAEAIPSAAFLLLLFAVPESPRWLFQRGEEDKARRILARVSGADAAEREVEEIRATLAQEEGRLDELLTPAYRGALWIGILLPLFSQVSGINAIIYYGPDLLEKAGFRLGESLGGQVIVGIVNSVFTLIAIFFVDRVGRRPLILFGTAGLVISLAWIGLSFWFQVTSGWLVLAPILMFIACFAFSLGPLPWIIISEIFPTRIRGRAMSVGTFTIWAGCLAVAQTFPWLLERLGPSPTFWLYAVLVFPAIPVTLFMLPETKGRTLEEIEQSWHRHH
ncbi:MAG: sugar porter family MFS transporter [Thermoguttaceae bacterium]